MTDDSNITYLERVKRHHEQFLHKRRVPRQPAGRGYEASSFEPKLVRTAQRRPLDDVVAEEIKEDAET